MCYSGRCYWEDSQGDCRFPRIKAVRDKYPLPQCTMFDEEHSEDVEAVINDINKIIQDERNGNKFN